MVENKEDVVEGSPEDSPSLPPSGIKKKLLRILFLFVLSVGILGILFVSCTIWSIGGNERRATKAYESIKPGMTVTEVEKLADVVYPPDDIGAAPASGSFVTSGMLVAPCSIKTLSGLKY